VTIVEWKLREQECMDTNSVSVAEQTLNHVVKEVVDMKPLTIGKKYNCEEEWWDSGKVGLSQKQKDQWRSYVTAKLAEESCPVVDDNTPREELDDWKNNIAPI